MRHSIFCLLLILPVTACVADAPSAFDTHFLDETMRIDYFHTGNATDEVVSIDQIRRQGIWAGSQKHLIDDLNNGRYYAHIYDLESDQLLYSKGFDSFFGEYQTTAPAIAGEHRSYHESVLIPYPKKPVRFVLYQRADDQSLVEFFNTDIDPESYTIRRDPLDTRAIVVESSIGGDPHMCVDMVIVAEGYTAAEEAKFRKDLEHFTSVFLDHEPYKSMADKFNIRGVLLPSQDTGCDEPGRGLHRNTSVGTTFDSLGSERYLMTEENRALRDIAAQVPYDAISIMINSERYGGGGIYGLYATFITDNQWSDYVFLHEFGHSFIGLADEYYTSATAYDGFYKVDVEPVEPNITALLDPENLKWKDLVSDGVDLPTPWEKKDFDTMDVAYQAERSLINARIDELMRDGAPAEEVAKFKTKSEALSLSHQKIVDAYFAKSAFAGKVGAFEGAGYMPKGLYRSQLDCIMFSKGMKPFCAACEGAIRRVVGRYSE